MFQSHLPTKDINIFFWEYVKLYYILFPFSLSFPKVGNYGKAIVIDYVTSGAHGGLIKFGYIRRVLLLHIYIDLYRE